MTVTVIVGAQWGDEGKGKIVDRLAESAALVVRFQGGANAGHTIVRGDRTLALHLVPSGILHTRCAIGSGVVVDPWTLLEEVDGLETSGVPVAGRLVVSARAHLVLPHHRALDAAREEAAGAKSIGTTRRGIGPAYADRTARVGVRVADLFVDGLEARVECAMREPNALLATLYGREPLHAGEVVAALRGIAPRVEPFVGDVDAAAREVVTRGDDMLVEGAQGALLDLDAGTYPYVTSSHPTAAGACIGTGLHPGMIDRVIGVAKAYATRVGAGPFPTEVSGAVAEALVERGHEFGTTTGRRRRVGWIDFELLREAVALNGIGEFALTKLDVLSDLDRIGVGEGGTSELPGWKADISGCRSFDDLPDAARHFVEHVEQAVDVPITRIGVGPGSDALIER